MCPVNWFEQYLASTKDLRETQQGKPSNLFISLVKHHCPVTRATISRSILSLFTKEGIDTTIIKAHSVRGASTTAAGNALLPPWIWQTGPRLQLFVSFIANLFLPPLW